MRKKIIESFDEAVGDIPDGATIMMHCFAGPAGIAQNIISALVRRGSKNLTVISCNFAPGFLAGCLIPEIITPLHLIKNNQVKKVITSVVSLKRVLPNYEDPLEIAVKQGKIEVELVGQGTLAERIRAGGAGISGFYTHVGVGTILEKGKEKRIINGKECLLELSLTADFAFVRAAKSDNFGNLTYRGIARSYNPLIAAAAKVTIAEVDEIVNAGEMDPESIITPGIYVDRILKVPGER